MANVARPMIAQEIIKLGERAGNVLVAAPVDNIKPFARMRVEKLQEMILALLGGRLPRGRLARLGTRAARRDQEQYRARDQQAPRNPSRCVHISL